LTETRLCALDDIPEGGSNGFTVESSSGISLYMAIRREGRVFVYFNSCPHTGVPLDIRPGQFLSLDKGHIQCSTHGAKFRIDDGRCVSGPCPGQSLRAVESVVRDGAVYVAG
jgi:nitrite reductase/ring-hydroxylating ferredoxin subunit